MADNKKAIKERIRSVRSTKKITTAMEVIANAKLAKQRNIMEKNREYTSVLKETLVSVMAVADIESPFLQSRDDGATYYLVIGSDLGLCGAYNINIEKLLKDRCKKGDRVIVMGSKLIPLLNKDQIAYEEVFESDKITFADTKKIMHKMIEAFLTKEVSKVAILYTTFKNAVSFTPNEEVILPFKREEGQSKELIFDPDVDTVLDGLIWMSIESIAYSFYLETKISEQASRRMAMQNANDNAAELENDLILAYNQARQAAITQEITEIIAGADAL